MPASSPSNKVKPAKPGAKDDRLSRSSDQGLAFIVGSLVILIIAFIVYSPAIQAGFIWDDDVLLTGNPLIKAPDGLFSFWFTRKPIDYWPLTMSSFWLEWRLWGMNPMGYHATNVLLHALSAICLWKVLKRLSIPGAWWAALIFALHPVNVQSTAWIAERKNTLSMVFYLLSFLFFLRFLGGRDPHSALSKDKGRGISREWLYLFSILAFALALCAKTSGVMLPIILLGCIGWQRKAVTKGDILRLSPFFMLSLAMALLTIWFQYNRAIGRIALHDVGFAARLAGAGWAIWFYLYKAVLPFGLSFVYPHWEIAPNSALSYLPAAACAAALGILWWKRQSWSLPFLFAFGYFILMLLPVLGFLKVFFFRYSLVADHYQYLPIIGVIALAVGLLVSRRKTQANAILLPVALLLAALSFRQCAIYRNQDTLWADTLEKDPKSWMAHSNWGFYCAGLGRREEAISHYQAALAIKPDDSGSLFNLGASLLEEGKTPLAVENFRNALKFDPDNVEALSGLAWVLAINRNPAIHNGEEAARHARHAVNLTHGEDALKLDTLAASEAAANCFDKAVEAELKALDLARASAAPEEIAGMEKRLQLYKSGRPFLEGD